MNFSAGVAAGDGGAGGAGVAGGAGGAAGTGGAGMLSATHQPDSVTQGTQTEALTQKI